MFVFSYTVGIQYYEKHEKKKQNKTNGQHPFSTNDKLVGGFEFPFSIREDCFTIRVVQRVQLLPRM